MNWLNNLRLSLRIALSFGTAALILLSGAFFVTDKLQQLNDGVALANEFWLMTYFLMAVIIIAGFMWYRSLAVPLRLLTEATHEVAAGKWGTQAKLKSKDEFGKLADSFNEMSASISRFTAYLNEVGSPVYAIDKNFSVQFANLAAIKFAGMKNENAVSKKKCYDIFKLPICRTAECPVSRSWNERKMISGESSAKPGNTEVPVMYQATFVSDADGNVSQGVEVLTDITAMKNFSNRIEAEREYLSENVNILLGKMEKFTNGDLTINLYAEHDDEIGKLYSGFNKAVENIREMIGQIIQTVESTASASSQISSSAEELAAGAQEQSANTGEVSAAVEEMTRTVLENSKNATYTADVAKKNGTVAREGGAVVEQTIKKIRDIADVVQKSAATVEQLGNSTQQIGEIISVIDDIADQTNLLALNAAIEAARAGEEGRGFAVVADEVRKLAERTTQATKQIATMIKNVQTEAAEAVDSMKRGNAEVVEGIRLADKAGVSLKNIVDNTQQVVDMMMQIAAASEEQSSTSESIAKNVEAISTVSIDSANGISQIARSADDLNGLTESLQSLVLNFKVNRNDTERGDSFSKGDFLATDHSQKVGIHKTKHS